MELFFSLFLVVLLWSNNNALRCVNHTDERRFKASQLIEVKEFIDNLNTAPGYEACSIRFGIEYPENIFVVLFGVDMGELSDYANRYVFYHLELTLSSNGRIIDPASGLKSFFFTCDNQDACERQFWRDHIDWFVRKESPTLEAALRSILITKNQEKVECAAQLENDRWTCSGDACIKYYRRGESMERQCDIQGQRETGIRFVAEISFSTKGNTNDSLTMRRSNILFEYICQFNNCNNQETENKIKEAIDNHFDLSSIHEVFKTKLEEKTTTKPASRSISYSTRSEISDASTSAYQQTMSRTPNTSILHFISMNILISHILFLIFF